MLAWHEMGLGRDFSLAPLICIYICQYKIHRLIEGLVLEEKSYKPQFITITEDYLPYEIEITPHILLFLFP